MFSFKTPYTNRTSLDALSFASTTETLSLGIFIPKFLEHMKIQFNEFLSEYIYKLNRFDKIRSTLIQKEWVRQILNNINSRPIVTIKKQLYQFAETNFNIPQNSIIDEKEKDFTSDISHQFTVLSKDNIDILSEDLFNQTVKKYTNNLTSKDEVRINRVRKEFLRQKASNQISIGITKDKWQELQNLSMDKIKDHSKPHTSSSSTNTPHTHITDNLNNSKKLQDQIIRKPEKFIKHQFYKEILVKQCEYYLTTNSVPPAENGGSLTCTQFNKILKNYKYKISPGAKILIKLIQDKFAEDKARAGKKYYRPWIDLSDWWRIINLATQIYKTKQTKYMRLIHLVNNTIKK